MSGDECAIIRAGAIHPAGAPAFRDGWVLVRGSRIADFGRGSAPDPGGARRIDLPGQCLLPGLINAHCHLEYTAFRGALSARGGFAAWLRDLNALKHSFSDEDWLRSIRTGFGELLRHGVTTVVNIVTFPHLLPRVGRPPIRAIWCVELSDVRPRLGRERLAEFEEMIAAPSRAVERGAFGISPHAPYTASPALFHEADALAEKNGLLLTTHAAESSEETLLFAKRAGPLFDLLAPLRCEMSDCGGTTALRHLAERCGMRREWLLAHVNEVLPGDAELLAAIRPGIVTCPRSGRYFGHNPFPLDLLRDAGCRISLGTDSLASNRDLDLFAEMRAARDLHPGSDPEDVLRMATVDAAAAIGWAGEIGEIKPGALADLIAIPFTPAPDGAPPSAGEIIEHRGPVGWMMIGGELAE